MNNPMSLYWRSQKISYAVCEGMPGINITVNTHTTNIRMNSLNVWMDTSYHKKTEIYILIATNRKL